MTSDFKPCILPWINFCTNPYGRSRPCGYSKFKGSQKVQNSTIEAEFNNSIYKQVRLDFLAGKWPENCQRCQFMEESHQGKSKKFSEQYHYDRYHHLIKRTNKDGSVDHFPKQIDIRLGTVCNLKCIHCGTGNSSKWSEDKALIGKYENTKKIKIDNKWVDHDSQLWSNIKDHLGEIEKFNFLGGEPFASRQHGKLIDYISRTPYAKKISLQYVTNGTLLTESVIEKLKKFYSVTLNVSFDACGSVLEFYRYPLRTEKMTEILSLLDKHSADDHFNVGLQWTSSNISLFYLNQSLKYIENNFKNLKVLLCNFVDSPVQMSAQNLPQHTKDQISRNLAPALKTYPDIQFYLDHMNKENLWDQHSSLLLNYLDDLSRTRRLDWKDSLKEFSQALSHSSLTGAYRDACEL